MSSRRSTGCSKIPSCRLLTLVGPGASGKTRLALEAAARRIDRYPARRPLRPAHLRRRAPELPRPGRRRRAPVPDRRRTQRLLGAGPTRRLPQRAFDAARARQLRAPRRGRRARGAGDRAGAARRDPDHVARALKRPERMGARRARATRSVRQRHALGPIAPFGSSKSAHGRSTPASSSGEEEQEHAARICRLVDGMPLGIELARRGSSMLPCAEIADEIERTIDFLETSMRDVPERHRSLRAAFDHSWRLLTDEQKRSFRQLSVFRGSFAAKRPQPSPRADLGLLARAASPSRSCAGSSSAGTSYMSSCGSMRADRLVGGSLTSQRRRARAPCPLLHRPTHRSAAGVSSARASSEARDELRSRRLATFKQRPSGP